MVASSVAQKNNEGVIFIKYTVAGFNQGDDPIVFTTFTNSYCSATIMSHNSIFSFYPLLLWKQNIKIITMEL